MATLPETARATPDGVRDLLGVDAQTLSDDALVPHITDAHEFVTQRLKMYYVSPGTLRRIETNIAADYALDTLARDEQGRHISSESEMNVSVSYGSASGGGHSGDDKSDYWYRAVELDPTGALQRRTDGWPTSVG